MDDAFSHGCSLYLGPRSCANPGLEKRIQARTQHRLAFTFAYHCELGLRVLAITPTERIPYRGPDCIGRRFTMVRSTSEQGIRSSYNTRTLFAQLVTTHVLLTSVCASYTGSYKHDLSGDSISPSRLGFN